MIQVTDTIQIPDTELQWSYARSGGPGGQNVNKVASKAVLRWAMTTSTAVGPGVKDRLRRSHPAWVTNDGEVLVSSDRFRDQERNRTDCEEKLAAAIRHVLVPPTPRKKTRPTLSSKLRRLDTKKRQSERKSGRRTVGDGD